MESAKIKKNRTIDRIKNKIKIVAEGSKKIKESMSIQWSKMSKAVTESFRNTAIREKSNRTNSRSIKQEIGIVAKQAKQKIEREVDSSKKNVQSS